MTIDEDFVVSDVVLGVLLGDGKLTVVVKDGVLLDRILDVIPSVVIGDVDITLVVKPASI